MGIICTLGTAYILIILVRIVLSWFPLQPDGMGASVFGLLITVTEPVLGPVRRALPPVNIGAARLDLSPILVILGLQILLGILCN